MNFDQFRFSLRATLCEWLHLSDQALEAWTEVRRINPSHLVAVRSIAWIQARKERWIEAAAGFEQAVALESTHADSWFNLGYARENIGQTDAAQAAFVRCTEINPHHDRAWYGQGMIHAHRGDHGAAAEALQRAAELQPMNGIAWYALGMAHYHNHAPESVEGVIRHLALNEPPTAKRLIRDTERADLTHLVEPL